MADYRHVTKCRAGGSGDLPSGLLPHAEAGASPGSETLGVPSLLCTRVPFELCVYTAESRNDDSGKSLRAPNKTPAIPSNSAAHDRPDWVLRGALICCSFQATF